VLGEHAAVGVAGREQLLAPVAAARFLEHDVLSGGTDGPLFLDCPGWKPPKRAIKRPARPYKSPIHKVTNAFATENAKER
jgi:hypothetical protein